MTLAPLMRALAANPLQPSARGGRVPLAAADEFRVGLWDGRDAAGRELGSGVYLCRFEAEGTVRLRKPIKLD